MSSYHGRATGVVNWYACRVSRAAQIVRFGIIGGDSENPGLDARLTALGLSLLKKVDMVGVQAYRACVARRGYRRGKGKRRRTENGTRQRRGDEYSSNERHETSNDRVFEIGVSSMVQPRGGQAYFIHSRGKGGDNGRSSSDGDGRKGPQSQQGIRRIERTVGVTKSVCKLGFVGIAAWIALSGGPCLLACLWPGVRGVQWTVPPGGAWLCAFVLSWEEQRLRLALNPCLCNFWEWFSVVCGLFRRLLVFFWS